jgi:hypothetical protein
LFEVAGWLISFSLAIMEDDKVSSILSAIRRGRPFDLFLLSFLLMPFIFEKWTDVFTKMGVGATGTCWSLVGILVAYIVCVIALLCTSSRRQKAQLARDQIIGYLQSNGFTMMGCDRVREKIHRGYSDAYLESVIREFPTELRFARLRGGRKGVARIVEETSDVEA